MNDMVTSGNIQKRLFERFVGLGGTPEHFFDLARHYEEPLRTYHTLAHVAKVLEAIDTWYPYSPRWLLFAAYYHDVIYDPTSQDNELESSRYASLALKDTLDARELASLNRAVLLTKGHDLKHAHVADLPLLVGDLIGMACDVEEYRANTARIRAEYAMYDFTQWSIGRRRFMAEFDTRRILPREERFDEFERRIHENMHDELLRLEDPRAEHLDREAGYPHTEPSSS